MKIDFIEPLGSGAFADVWKARDELGREVAVKIIRQANEGVANALAHAKALARATHPNVVSVLTLESTKDPQTQQPVECVVMELINGNTLEKRLNTEKLSRDEVVSLGLGIIQGLAHIHAQGMTHGDLHAQNVMTIGDEAKIIDILYINSLASISTEKRDDRVSRDLFNLQSLLASIISASDLECTAANEFFRIIKQNPKIEDIKSAYCKVTQEPEEKSKSDDILIKFKCAPNVIPIHGEFNVEIENKKIFASLISRLSLRLPVKVSVQLYDPINYTTLGLDKTPYRREDLIESAIEGVEKRRGDLERRINWCLDAIKANYSLNFTYIEQCVAHLCEYPAKMSGATVAIDVVSHENPAVYFRTHLPNAVIQQIAENHQFSRPITKIHGFDLFDLPEHVVIGHVLPSYAFFLDTGYKLPHTFLIGDWCWGEA